VSDNQNKQEKIMMRMMNMGVVSASMLLGIMSMMSVADEPSGWKVDVTPYAWLAGIEGDATVGGHKAEFDKSFSDLVDMVDAAGSLLGVVQYDRYVFWGQMDYVSTSTDALDVDDQPKAGSFDSDLFLLEAAVGYQIDGWQENQTIDIMVGVRSLDIQNDLEIYGRGMFSKDVSLVDPMIVIRPRVALFPSKIDGLTFNGTMGIGGGGDSDMVYELAPQVEYQINESMIGRFGYRRVGYKFVGENDENELNIALAGLVAGLGVTF
jgi:hypothetical protein